MTYVTMYIPGGAFFSNGWSFGDFSFKTEVAGPPISDETMFDPLPEPFATAVVAGLRYVLPDATAGDIGHFDIAWENLLTK